MYSSFKLSASVALSPAMQNLSSGHHNAELCLLGSSIFSLVRTIFLHILCTFDLLLVQLKSWHTHFTYIYFLLLFWISLSYISHSRIIMPYKLWTLNYDVRVCLKLSYRYIFAWLMNSFVVDLSLMAPEGKTHPLGPLREYFSRK